MIRALLIALLFCTPLAAEYESNFGRVTLANCDLIVQGVASAKRTRVAASFRVEVTVQQVLYGETEQREVSVYYTDDKMLKDNEPVRALFALKTMATGGFSIVGKPVYAPESEPESAAKQSVCEAFVALEQEKQGDERTSNFWALLVRHIRQGGFAAQNAAVELMFVAQHRSSIVTEERFTQVQDARGFGEKALTTQTKEDLKLAFQGLVEAGVKTLKFRRIRRGDTKEERRSAATELLTLVEEYPRAFTEADAKLTKAIADQSQDAVLNETLAELERAIILEVRVREAAEKSPKPQD